MRNNNAYQLPPNSDEPLHAVDIENEVAGLTTLATDRLLQTINAEAQQQKAQNQTKDPTNLTKAEN